VSKLRHAGLEAAWTASAMCWGHPGAARSIPCRLQHTDTVPKGGWLDGALGVGYALEIARSAIEENSRWRPASIISFQDEEAPSCRFSRQPLGPPVSGGGITAPPSKDGSSLATALATIAGEPPPHRFDGRRQVCYLEAHIEQGPRMEAAGQRIGVVSALVGIRRFRIRSHGAANHAGTTPMAMRRDAGAALFELATAVNAEFRRLPIRPV
jgi:N-carbamoyl-L-amino-acid hydrolase